MEHKFWAYPFEESPPDYTQITDDIEYVPVEVPENNHPPSPKFPKTSGGSSVEQTTEREEENGDENLQEIQDEESESSQKTPKENTPETQTQKTPENSKNTPLQEEPINTRGEKYNTIYVLIPTQTTSTHTDTRKTQPGNHLFPTV